ncbi:iron-sulfur cluster-binding protein [Phototrophicus methaneseepsis]|uniref:Iron-sulfur cluster-binding protein n=1 Tax=Phototrophicus methaneseepsis TaxID=2710758 RepID=A0A7S8IE16_9CHLR|nr:LutB/LldF family L-lactate oxidation iron-sulfur protein [Phototrophicus methaneseepsis]QPC81373.1 iron-sulfur cluster-binding protein [Phototrophicus methaneseepsis]
MQVTSNNFISLADIALHKPDLQEAVSDGTRRAYYKRAAAMFSEGQEHGEFMRQQAAEAKRRALRNLPDNLELAEKNLKENGFQVKWAVDADEAQKLVIDILKSHQATLVTKSKSMLSEEIGLNHALEAVGARVVETDLGEYIIQLNHEPPSHIVAPVIHKTKPEIRDIFVRELGMEPTDDAGEMVAFARKMLRADFLASHVGISGGNFVIAETGSLGLVMNEGNGRMCTSVPDVHIALVGIEKVIETVEDYATLDQVLTRTGTGQKLTVYTNIINGPRREGEADGPREVYIIFVDNGRSDVYATTYAEALSCIRCGACQNACPVYRSVGGHSYGWVYGGPIGAVLTPLYTGLENASPLPHASSLCGSCKQVCPVDIDLPRMLLDLRRDLVQQKVDDKWKTPMRIWAFGMQSPMRFEMGGRAARLGKAMVGDHLPSVLGNWTEYRDFPDFAPKSFHQMWRDRQKGREQ